MDNINDLLGFHFKADTFAKMGMNVINTNLIDRVENEISKLKKISNKIDAIGSGVDKSIDINPILAYINKNESLPELSMKNEKKVLRALCYYLSEIKSNNAIADILQSLDRKWQNSFYWGLIDYVFQFWNPVSQNFCRVRDFLRNKLNSYNGTNSKYIFIRDNIKYLENNGPIMLGVKLKSAKKSILSCTEVLGMSDQKITYRYFSDVIYSYCKYKFDECIGYDELDKVLNLHNNSLTDKSVIPLFIARKKNLTTSWKDALEFLSKERIGDCENNAKWSLPIEVETERHDLLKQAQNLIRVWTNEKYINIYFEKCVDDPRRKIFWLKYIKDIEKIRIAGSRVTKQTMSTDMRLMQLLHGKFILGTKNTRSDTSAIIMQIRGKIYIEFSETGNALYVYQEHNLPINKLFSCFTIQSINSLKRTNMDQLIDTSYWNGYDNDYGRMVHIGEWEHRLSNYISRH